MRLLLIGQPLLQPIDTLQQSFQNIGLRTSLLWDGIVKTRALKDLAGLAGRPETVALDLTLSAGFAVHRLALLSAGTSSSIGRQPLYADLRASHDGSHGVERQDSVGIGASQSRRCLVRSAWVCHDAQRQSRSRDWAVGAGI